MNATVTVGLAGAGVDFPQVSAAPSGSANINVNETVAAGQTDKEVKVAFPYGALALMAIYADKACHVKTNSTSNPSDEFDLAAGQFKLFVDDGTNEIGDNPFTADVTKIYVTTTGDPVNLRMAGIYDATP